MRPRPDGLWRLGRMNSVPVCWAVVPAAGTGQRMGVAIPKQYLTLGGKPVIRHTLEALLASPAVCGIVVALAERDAVWDKLAPSLDRPLLRTCGGAERSDSVLNALRELADRTRSDDWVLVHDAARPCLRREDLTTLMRELGADPVGGLLALPVHDTMKQAAADQRVLRTLPRESLWRALTPQMFRIGSLVQALERAAAEGASVTDEASAMEYAGHAPRLVEGHADNIKITHPEDLALAEYYLRQQGRL